MNIEFEKDEMMIVDGHSKTVDGYVVKDFPVFGIAKYKLKDSGAQPNWQWSIIHIPSEDIFSDIFRTKKSAEEWLDIFLEETQGPKQILLTVPGVRLIRIDFAEEIRTTFAEWNR
jgi:hypothetical protein